MITLSRPARLGVVASVLLAAGAALAAGGGSLSGHLTDPQGRPVANARITLAPNQVGLHFQLASGYTGQTTKVLALPGEGDPFERVVGVYIPSYVTASFSYHFGRQAHP